MMTISNYHAQLIVKCYWMSAPAIYLFIFL